MVVENKKITVIPVPVPVLVQVFSLVTVEKKAPDSRSSYSKWSSVNEQSKSYNVLFA